MKYNKQAFCDLSDKEKLKIIENELSLVIYIMGLQKMIY